MNKYCPLCKKKIDSPLPGFVGNRLHKSCYDYLKWYLYRKKSFEPLGIPIPIPKRYNKALRMARLSIPDAETTKSRSQEKISDSADPQKMKVRNDHEGDN